jgi:hypothetical protein
MKFRTSFCSHQRNSPTFEEFLLSNYEKIDNNQNESSSQRRNQSSDRQTQTQPTIKPEKQHISRRWCYITSEDEKDSPHHKVILEAPFVRMKEIHINPPQYPIREDSRKFRYKSSNNCINYLKISIRTKFYSFIFVKFQFISNAFYDRLTN